MCPAIGSLKRRGHVCMVKCGHVCAGTCVYTHRHKLPLNSFYDLYTSCSSYYSDILLCWPKSVSCGQEDFRLGLLAHNRQQHLRARRPLVLGTEHMCRHRFLALGTGPISVASFYFIPADGLFTSFSLSLGSARACWLSLLCPCYFPVEVQHL